MKIDKDGNLYEPTTTRSTFRPEQGSVIHMPIKRREETIPEGYVKVVRCKDCAYYENCLDTYMIPADCCPQGKRKEETE